MKKLVLLAYVFVAALGIGVIGSAPPAKAFTDPGGSGGTASFTWVDEQTIRAVYTSGATELYIDSKVGDNTHIFVEQRGSDSPNKLSCTPTYANYHYNGAYVITFHDISKPSQGTFVTFSAPTDPTNQHCGSQTNTDVGIASPEYADTTYEWADAGTIIHLGTSEKFLVSSSQSTLYVMNNSGSCHPSMTLQDGGKAAKYTDSQSQEPVFAGETAAQNGYSHVNGCWTRTDPGLVLLGYPDNQYLTAGSNQTADGSGDGDAPDPCADAAGSYAWMACPAYTAGQSWLDHAYGYIQDNLLQVDPLGGNTTLKQVVNVFAGLANILFIIIFLIMIFGTTFNASAYTVKKSMPRLVIAVVAVQFSYFLCGIVVDIGNILGAGIEGLVQTALHTAGVSTSPTFIDGLLSAGAALGAVGALSALVLGPAVLLILLSLVLSVFTFFLMLVMRKIAIIALIMLAPLAIAAWVLPNTEPLFKRWRSAFVKIIMIYPIMSLIIAAGYVAQAATGAVKYNNTGAVVAPGSSGISHLIGAIIPIIAFFYAAIRAPRMGGPVMDMVNNAVRRTGAPGAADRAWRGGSGAVRAPFTAFGNNRRANGQARLQARAANINGGGVAGLRGRVAGLRLGYGTGVNLTGAARQRYSQRVLSGQNAAIANARKAFAGQSRDDIAKTILGADATTGNPTATRRPGTTALERMAAISELAAQGDTANLQKVLQAHYASSGGTSNKEWTQGMAGQAGNIKDSAPHLAGGNYGGMTSDKLSKLDKIGAQGLMDHLSRQRQIIADPASKPDQITAALKEISDFQYSANHMSTDQRTRVKNEVGQTILQNEDSTGATALDGAIMTSLNIYGAGTPALPTDPNYGKFHP